MRKAQVLQREREAIFSFDPMGSMQVRIDWPVTWALKSPHSPAQDVQPGTLCEGGGVRLESSSLVGELGALCGHDATGFCRTSRMTIWMAPAVE